MNLARIARIEHDQKGGDELESKLFLIIHSSTLAARIRSVKAATALSMVPGVVRSK